MNSRKWTKKWREKKNCLFCWEAGVAFGKNLEVPLICLVEISLVTEGYIFESFSLQQHPPLSQSLSMLAASHFSS